MATKRLTPLRSIIGVSAGNTAVQKIPIGPRYHTLMIGASGAGKHLKTLIKDIRLMVNGKVQREYTPQQLDDRNSVNGNRFAYVNNGTGKESLLCIHLAEPWRKDPEVADGMAWRTKGLDSFQLEIDVADDAPANTKITVYAVADDSILRDQKSGQALPVQLLEISKVVRKTTTLTGKKHTDFDVEPGDFIQVISFYDPHILAVRLKLNKFEVIDIPKVVNDKRLVDHGLVPVPGRFDLIFDADDPPGSALPIARGDVPEFELVVAEEDEDDETTAFPRPIDVIVERAGRPN